MALRPVGAFACAIPDAPPIAIPTTESPNAPRPCSTTFAFSSMDACTEAPAGCFGHLGDLMWYFPLEGPWMDKPITVTEPLTVGIHLYQLRRVIELGPEHVACSDATTALAILMGRPGCANSRYISRRLRSDPLLSLTLEKSWALHISGAFNAFDDAGSRGRFEEVFQVGAALGRKLTWMQLNGDALAFANDVLHNTEPLPRPCQKCHQIRGIMVGLDVCPSCSAHDGPPPLPKDSPLAYRSRPPLDDKHAPRPPLSPGSPLRCRSSRTTASSRAPRLPPSPARPERTATQERTQATRTLQLSPDLAARPRGTDKPTVSPQPLTAAAARARAGHDIADQLAADKSPYALFPTDPQRLRAECLAITQNLALGIPANTLSSDEWGFKWFVRFSLEAGHTWMCPRITEPKNDLNLEIRYSSGVRYIAARARPSPRKAHRGAGRAQPPTALAAAYAYRRVQHFCGRQVPDMRRVALQIRGLNLLHKRDFGLTSLVRQHANFISHSLFASFLHALLDATCPLAGVLHDALLAAIAYSRSTGARKDEWTRSRADDIGYLRRSHFVNCDSRSLPIQRPMQPGDFLRCTPGESKTDQDNRHWGDRPMWFRYDPSNPWSLAYRWQQWELTHPCPVHLRDTWPAFSPSGDHRPFSPSQADAALFALLVHVTGGTEAARALYITWHSHRVTLARAIVEGGHAENTDAIAQALVRWRTADSVHLYGQLTHTRYADYIDAAIRTDVSTADDTPIPMCSIEQLADELDAVVDGIETPKCSLNDADAPASAPAATPPQSPKPDHETPSHSQNLTAYDLGRLGIVHARDTDRHSYIGRTLSIPNHTWGIHDGRLTECRIVGHAPGVRYKRTSGVYVLHASDDDLYYPFTLQTLRSVLRS